MTKIKYPRTPHLPFSEGRTSDDKVLASLDHFNDREIVITVKMDGENTSIYRNAFHARSLDSRHHESRDWIARFQSEIGYMIPEDFRICGENLYASHSIKYENLPSYFLAFSVWNRHTALSWDSTISFLDNLGVARVEELYRGKFDVSVLKQIASEFDTVLNEGFVVRVTDSFEYGDFSKSVAKWVRKNHVQTSDHWMHSSIIPNGIAKSA